jgi:uncharacterized membrane protein YbhN (UPF0104 family)
MIAAGATEVPGQTSLPFVSPRRLVLGLLISAVTVAVLARTLDLAQVRAAVEVVPDEPGVLLAAALAYSAAFWLRALAWRLLLSTKLSTGRLFSVLQASLFLNHLLPFKAGEIARPYLVVRKGVPAAEAASTTVVARLMDFIALALISLLVLPAVTESAQLRLGLAFAVALLFAAGAVLVLLRQGMPLPLPARLTSLGLKAQAALRDIRPAALLLASPLVLVSWLLEGAVLFASARLLGVELSLATVAGATAFTVLLQVVQLTPGGIGVYETSMTTVLVLQGVPADQALTLAVITHGLKFVYSFSFSPIFAVGEAVSLVRGRAEDDPSRASRFEIVSARLWNVLNEGKPFTPVFALGVLLLLSLPQAFDPSYWLRFAAATLLLAPLAAVFFRFDFPLKLRAGLWVYLVAFIALFRYFDLVAAALVLTLYLLFTVVMWGTVYYHLRMGTAWTNFLRFWRLVLENPDPTSGNLQEQLPKVLLLIFAVQYLAGDFSPANALGIEAFTLAVAVTALLIHQWFFTWVPALPQPGYASPTSAPRRISKRFIAIVIDGCRADRLREAHTPFIDRARAAGIDFTDVSTVYPARTVTGFSSMLTGAAPAVHGMRSNFVPSLGVKCDSVFAALRRSGMKGRLVGIAHLVDAFGHEDVRTVTAVMHNDEIDDALVARAKRVLEEDDPELLVLQLLSVDQTGHARGSYNDEYLRKIEATDDKIEAFLAWCEERGYLDETTLLITADHGQGIGIGGHGHMTPPEIRVPCILWGHGVKVPMQSEAEHLERFKSIEGGQVVDEPRFVTDVAATICRTLGVAAPRESVGRSLLPLATTSPAEKPLVFVIPAYNEAAGLPGVLASIERTAPQAKVVVVDDGSTDGTDAVAAAQGALVVRHERNRGLGAALRTGLAVARDLNPRAAVYLDADGEYDASEALRLLEPIESGEADYVLGSRFKGTVAGMTLSRRLANHCFSLLLSFLCGRWVSDGQTGFRAFSRRALDVAEIVHDYNYAQVLTLDLLHKGMRTKEVPVSYRRRKSGRSFVSARYLWRVPLGMVREMLAD